MINHNRPYFTHKFNETFEIEFSFSHGIVKLTRLWSNGVKESVWTAMPGSTIQISMSKDLSLNTFTQAEVDQVNNILVRYSKIQSFI